MGEPNLENPPTCKSFIEKARDIQSCAIGVLGTRAIVFNESPNRRPLGIALDALEACGMAVNGLSQREAKSVTDRICRNASDYETKNWCRSERGF